MEVPGSQLPPGSMTRTGSCALQVQDGSRRSRLLDVIFTCLRESAKGTSWVGSVPVPYDTIVMPGYLGRAHSLRSPDRADWVAPSKTGAAETLEGVSARHWDSPGPTGAPEVRGCGAWIEPRPRVGAVGSRAEGLTEGGMCSAQHGACCTTLSSQQRETKPTRSRDRNQGCRQPRKRKNYGCSSQTDGPHLRLRAGGGGRGLTLWRVVTSA